MKKYSKRKKSRRRVKGKNKLEWGVFDHFTKELKDELEKLMKLKRRQQHPAVHRISSEYKLSKRTLFYIKEYNTKSNISTTIIKESWKVLILASILSSIGGLGLRYVEQNIVSILPLLIVIPALNDLVGDFGTITASKFTNMLFFRAVDKRWWRSKQLRYLLLTLFTTSVASAVFIGVMSSLIPHIYQGTLLNIPLMIKVLAITLVTSVSLFGIVFIISVAGGLYFYKRGEDPNNFLIPITTSVADLGSLLIFSALVYTMF